MPRDPLPELTWSGWCRGEESATGAWLLSTTPNQILQTIMTMNSHLHSLVGRWLFICTHLNSIHRVDTKTWIFLYTASSHELWFFPLFLHTPPRHSCLFVPWAWFQIDEQHPLAEALPGVAQGTCGNMGCWPQNVLRAGRLVTNPGEGLRNAVLWAASQGGPAILCQPDSAPCSKAH